MCSYNPEIYSNVSCKLSFINRLQKSYTVKLFIKKRIDSSISNVQLYYKFRNGYQLFLVNVSTDLCAYIKGDAPSKVLDYMVPWVNQYAEPKIHCPCSGWFQIKDMPLNGKIFDYLFLPVGNYMLNSTLRLKNGTFLWNSKFYFIIPEGKTIEDDRMGR